MPNKKTISAILIFLLFTYCTKKESRELISDDFNYNEEIAIGLLDQGDEYQLGQPMGVRTDSSGHIYIADRSMLTIKKFSDQGEFLENIGRRGRGPAEFHDINMFELDPSENFVVVDKGNFRYKIISKSGEELLNKEIDINPEWQFYPNAIAYSNNEMISLFQNPVGIRQSPLFERELFYSYTTDFEEQLYSFFKFSELEGLDDKFSWVSFMGKPGSFTLNSDDSELFYSPIIYTGNIYMFKKKNEKWKFEKVVKGSDPFKEPYVVLDEEEYSKYKEDGIPGLSRTYFDTTEPYSGRVNSADAGIFILNNGNLIQFISEWKDNFEKNSPHQLTIRAQIINSDHEVVKSGEIYSIKTIRRPWVPIINWKDQKDRFYMIESTDSIPIVKRFSISLD